MRVAAQIRDRAIARKKGIVIADTKFEFGLGRDDAVVLVDEVLAPDTPRYWPTSLLA